MNRFFMATSLSVTVLSSAMGFAAPLQPIPDESGASGSLVVGVSGASYSSNMIAGPDGELGNKTVSNIFDSPDSESDSSPFFTGEFRYTFSEARAQAYLGVALEDLVRYDLAFQLGARKQLSNQSIVYGAFLFSAIPTEVYSDPYVANVPRDEIDRSSAGLRLGWQNMFGSSVGMELSSREIKLDKENSGLQLVADSVITAEEQRLLDREGNQTELTTSYIYRLGKGHLLVPELNLERFDLDGKARSRDRVGATLAYFYTAPSWSLVATMFYSVAGYEEVNPIYDVKEEVDNYGASLVVTYNGLFGAKDLSLFSSVAAAESNSNIDFYDQEASNASLGVIYRF